MTTVAAKPRYATQAKIRAAIAAAEKSGIKVAGIRTGPDGSVEILRETGPILTSAYDRWKASRPSPVT